MNGEEKMLKYIYEMKKDVAVIREHMKHINGSLVDQAKEIDYNKTKINQTNMRLSKWGGIAFGILVALQVFSFIYQFIHT
jgi:hypothetical protein